MKTSTAERSALRELTELYGVQRSYKAADQRRVTAKPEAALAVLAALGADVQDGNARAALAREQEQRAARLIEPVIVAWGGELPELPARKGAEYEITLESGAPFDMNGGARLPFGYHELQLQSPAGAASALLLSAPVRCHPGTKHRTWGVFAPLYALREQRGKAIGDISDLEKLLSWVNVLGGDFAATLPISAAFLTEPFDPSPYSPASRLYWNEIYVDIDRILANSDCVPARNRASSAEWRAAMSAASAGRYVDYRDVAQHKRHIMTALADWFYLQHREKSADFEAFLELYPDAERYAQFRAVGERMARGWPAWPERLRGGRIELQDFDEDAARYHLYAQFVMHQQLNDLARHARVNDTTLYLDMPLGVHPDSYDVWSMPQLFVNGVSAGAPPDPFFTKGQNWGFPPLNPPALRADRYEYLRRVLATQLRYAGMLRIDHVMSLHRLFFVPNGFEATDGVYVRYPQDELYAVLAIESQRYRSTIIGEDLGTVPAEVRQSMKRHGVKRMFVVQFEASDADPPLRTPPAEAVASLNTHDMPPFAAYWNARDAELREEMGLLDAGQVQDQHKSRDRLARAIATQLRSEGFLDDAAVDRLLHRKPEPREALRALLLMLAASPADLVLINLEDLWQEEEPQNVPGTSQEKPNWRRRLAHSLSEVRAHDEVSAILQAVNAARQAPRDGR